MFKVKIKHKLRYLLTALMLAIFTVGSSFSLMHNFSHHGVSAVEISKDQPLKKHDANHCALCFFEISQHQIFISAGLIFAAIAFYLSFFSRIFDRVKASFLFSSHLSQAPPALS